MSVYVQRGSKGRWVAALQEALNAAGYDLDVDGDFGSGTEAAVRGFQRDSGLSVDGVVGPNTWAQLGIETGGDDDDNEEGYEQVARGSQGEAVSFLQEVLNVVGYDLAVDGIFGRDTEAAVRAFQAEHGLTADGIVGDNTWGALEEYMEE